MRGSVTTSINAELGRPLFLFISKESAKRIKSSAQELSGLGNRLYELTQGVEVFRLIPAQDCVVVAERESQSLLRTGGPFVVPLRVRNIDHAIMLGVHHKQRILIAGEFLLVVELLSWLRQSHPLR